MDSERNSPWDVFIHLFAVIAVCTAVYGAASLLFSLVNATFPDPLDSRLSIDDDLRYAIAILFISFPVYCWTWRSIQADLVRNPAKRTRWIRTCPIYLTIFLSGLLFLGDLICLLYYFLGGDLSVRFILKAAALALVAGGVLLFYRDALRSEPGTSSRLRRSLIYGSCVAVAVLLVAGIAVGGSPSQARLARFDRDKITDLDEIQTKIVGYWSAKGALPPTLADLRDSVSDFALPRDPQSDAPYGYRVTSPTSFELCADFNLVMHGAAQELNRWKKNDSEIWDHTAGHVCFPRTIDPELHPPKSSRPSS